MKPTRYQNPEMAFKTVLTIQMFQVNNVTRSKS